MSGAYVARVAPGALAGEVRAIASKSAAHRLLICAALADAPCLVRCATTSRDIEATSRCLEALGSRVERTGDGFAVTPVPRDADGRVLPAARGAVLDCDESGSTLRFMLPVALALGADATFAGGGRLPERPLSPLREELEAHGCTLAPAGTWPLATEGRLAPGAFSFPGNVSSQFATGLLLALAALGGPARVSLTGTVESRPYIDMTREALAAFGVRVGVSEDGSRFEVPAGARLRSPGEVSVEGDWSNAAFWLCAGALGARGVTVGGLDLASAQGDLAVLDVLGPEGFGAHVRVHPGQGWARVSGADEGGRPCPLRGCVIDAADVPDLVPVLAVVAACAQGTTRVVNAGRLRLKESDRLATTAELLRVLGVGVRELPEGLEIEGRGDGASGACLSGARVSSHNDHRLAMAAAVAAARCDGAVEIADAQAVAKSYPGFFDDLRALGGVVDLAPAGATTREA